MKVTHCPRCKGILTFNEYRKNIRCPHCDGNLAAYSRGMQAYLGIITAAALSGIAYLYFRSKGGSSATVSSEKGFAIAFIGLVTVVSATTPIIDWIYVSIFKNRGGRIPFLVAVLFSLGLWYSPIGRRVQGILLAMVN